MSSDEPHKLYGMLTRKKQRDWSSAKVSVLKLVPHPLSLFALGVSALLPLLRSARRGVRGGRVDGCR